MLLAAGMLVVSLAVPGAQRAEAAAGCAKASSNDFDGDGRDDVVAGDPLADAAGVRGAGAVHVLPVGGDGPGRGLVITAPAPHPGDAFGWTVRTTHYDGDRCLDVIVGAPYADSGDAVDAGAVYVIRGGAYDGRVPAGAISEISAPKPERDAHFGWSLAAARSAGRPAGVIAVGAPYEDADGTGDSGAIYLYCAKPEGGAEPALRITQESEGIVGNGEQGDMYGWSLVFGRFGGRDDSVDLAVGTPYENDDGVGRQAGDSGKADTGAVEIIYDAAEAAKAYTSVKWGIPNSVKGVTEHPGDRYGYALAYAESGGRPYLAAGAPLADLPGATDAGLVQVFTRGKDGAPVPSRTIRLGGEGLADQPPKAGASIGWSLAMVGSATSLRLAIGGPFDSAGAPQGGAIRQVPLVGGPAGGAAQAGLARPYDHLGGSIAAFGAADSFGPGAGLLAGVPDRRDAPGGAVAVLRDGAAARLVVPGRDAVPAVPGGASVDFGASVSG
ncbi:integrin alpha [Sphaerisporangium sp. NPDC005289]|uniref:integrin alpha n=1 Tax=Sphaerisporangium sp. NPDC005289 TaxID=3155247 RepID=UPI0033AD1795